MDKQQELFGLRVVVNDQLPRGSMLLSPYPSWHVETDHVQTVRDAVEIRNLRDALRQLQIDFLVYKSQYPSRCFECGHGEVLADTVRVLRNELNNIKAAEAKRKQTEDDDKAEKIEQAKVKATNVYSNGENFYAPEWHQP